MSIHIIMYEILRSLWRNIYLLPRLLFGILAVYVCVRMTPALVKSIRSGVMRLDREGHYSLSFRDRPVKFIFQFVFLSVAIVFCFIGLGVICYFYYLDVVNHLNGAP